MKSRTHLRPCSAVHAIRAQHCADRKRLVALMNRRKLNSAGTSETKYPRGAAMSKRNNNGWNIVLRHRTCQVKVFPPRNAGESLLGVSRIESTTVLFSVRKPQFIGRRQSVPVSKDTVTRYMRLGTTLIASWFPCFLYIGHVAKGCVANGDVINGWLEE